MPSEPAMVRCTVMAIPCRPQSPPGASMRITLAPSSATRAQPQGAVDYRRQVQDCYAVQRMLRHRVIGAVGMASGITAPAGEYLCSVLTQCRGRPRRAGRRAPHVYHGAKLSRDAHSPNIHDLNVAVVQDLGMVQSLL